MRTSPIALPAAAVAVALAVVLGSGAVPGRAAPVDSLRYTESGYAVLDPARQQRPNDERLVLALFDPLTAIDPASGRVVPLAAERYEEAPDGRSWTFRLRSGGRWSDGTPVVASDFVEAWRRAVDPYEGTPAAPLFRVLRGGSTLAEADRSLRALEALLDAMKAALAEQPSGIPGRRLREAVERSGVRPVAERVDDPTVKRLLRWGEDDFPADAANAAMEALRKERRGIKKALNETFDAFGTTVGATAPDDATVVVLLDRRCPWLPALVARAAFAPLPPGVRKGGEGAFEPDRLVVNGPYRLAGRGPKPRAGVANPDSVVHLARRAEYAGAVPGVFAEVRCTTDQGPEEDVRRFLAKEVQWVANPAPALRAKLEKAAGYETVPAGSIVLLRFRVDRPPFDDPQVRRAFATAVDRSALAKARWPTPEPLTRLVPPGTPGAAGGVGGPAEDPAGAKKLLGTSKLDWLELHYQDLLGHEDPARDDPGPGETADLLARQWKKALGLDVGLRMENPEDARVTLAAGAYSVSLGELAAAVDDPAAWVLALREGSVEGGLGWKDPGFEALCDASLDPDALAAGGPEALARLPGGNAFAAAAAAARGGGAAEREALRRALLGAAEARALEACVVVPLLGLRRAQLVSGLRDVGSPAAWRNPAFVGSLRHARP